MEKKITLVVFCFLLLTGASSAQWTPINLRTTANFTCVYFATPSVVYIGGYLPSVMTPVMFKSYDGGANFTVISNFPAGFKFPVTLNFDSTGNNGIVAGLGPIISTTNGGSNWQVFYSPPDTIIIFDSKIDGHNYPVLWAGGNKYIAAVSGLGVPLLLKCTDIMSPNPTLQRYYFPAIYNNFQIHSVAGIDSNECLVLATYNNGSVILKTSNGGNNWFEVYSTLSKELFDMDVETNGSNGVVMGGDNSHYTIIRTTTGGSTWYTDVDAPGQKIRKFIQRGDTTYAVGNGGQIRRLIGWQQNWVLQNTSTSQKLQGVHYFHGSANKVFVVGDTGVVLKTLNGGVWVQNISTEIPSGYFLGQNYPNPFNSTTTIRFAVLKKDNVTIKIFDLLGKETDMIVNNVFEAGTFEVNYDASALTSGVYYYRITSGTFAEAKKLVLLK